MKPRNVTNTIMKGIGLAILAVCVAIALIVGSVIWQDLTYGRHKHGIATNVEEIANLRSDFRNRYRSLLPRSASDIQYFAEVRHYYFCASFNTTEADFLAWTRARGWRTVPRKEITVHLWKSYPSRGASQQTIGPFDGFEYREMRWDQEETGGFPLVVAFDPTSNTAYIEHNQLTH